MTRSGQERQTTWASLCARARSSAAIIPLSLFSAQPRYPAEGAVVKLTSGEIWIAVAVAVSVAIILVVLWFLVGPVLQLDGERWMP